MEKTVQDLYMSRKGEGSYQVEIDALKADNDRLLSLIKNTNEYRDMPDSQILKNSKLDKS